MNELNLLFFALYFSRLSLCYYYSLFFNDKRQTCLRDGKIESCPLYKILPCM